jgi:predicted nucleotidyltransferase
MKDHIIQEIKNLEQEHNIVILYAVESGSRAWGFPSTDSDWDVRFLYIHPLEWYLSIEQKRDTIEVMLPNNLDLAGWELRKTLQLFYKSNPALLEWLRSPLIYQERFSTAEQLRNLSNEFFKPKSCMYHYLSMAHGNFTKYLQSDLVKLKKYFYVLRPLLACRWIEQHNTIPPMEFETLVDTQISDMELQQIIQDLVARKRSGQELGEEPQIPRIHNYLTETLAYFQEFVKTYSTHNTPNIKTLDALFRSTLEEVWKS